MYLPSMASVVVTAAVLETYRPTRTDCRFSTVASGELMVTVANSVVSRGCPDVSAVMTRSPPVVPKGMTATHGLSEEAFHAISLRPRLLSTCTVRESTERPGSCDRPMPSAVTTSRLVVTAEGIGLSQLPGRSVLSRTVQVLSNLGRSDIAWKASSDSPWLAVIPFGTTGGDLVITADTSG